MDQDIKTVHFKDGLNHEFEIIDLAKIYENKKDMLVVAHRAQFYHILWIEQGEGTHYVDFNPVEFKDNTIIFIPHNSVNKFDVKGSYYGRVILFTKDFFCKDNTDAKFLQASMLFSDLYDVAKIKVDPQASPLSVYVNGMETEFIRNPDQSQYLILHNMLHVFLLQAEREMRKQGFKELKPSANLEYLILFKELLEDKFKEDKSVNKYAAALSISEKQLYKATTKLLAKTPKQIIDERILLESKRLLVHSSMSIKEIAYALGYEEPTNFIKYFRKHNQCTPSEFREKQLNR